MRSRPGFAHLRAAFRSGLEVSVAAFIAAAGVEAQYEKVKVLYTVPEKVHSYRPDWVLPNGIVLEGKGLWAVEDRQKMALIRQQHPDLDLRMVFTNPLAKIRKGSPTTYADVCLKLGIPYCKKEPPLEWLHAPRNEPSIAALMTLGYKPSS